MFETPTIGCPMRHLMQRLSDKWTLVIISALLGKDYQYGELERKLPGISRRMLTRTLNQCIKDGLILRTEQKTRPLTVRYSLTPLGRSLEKPLVELRAWSIEYGQTF
jgi:DNA-binding HxlR family transcriptional regulator